MVVHNNDNDYDNDDDYDGSNGGGSDIITAVKTNTVQKSTKSFIENVLYKLILL